MLHVIQYLITAGRYTGTIWSRKGPWNGGWAPPVTRGQTSDMPRLVGVLHRACLWLGGDGQLPRALALPMSKQLPAKKLHFLRGMTHHMLRIKQKALCSY